MARVEHFPGAQIETLRDLVELWGPDRFVLIGASALGCHMETRWRQTLDLDLTLAAGIEEYPSGLQSLAGWRPDPKQEQRWHGPGGVRVDVIPAGPRELDAGEILWPATGVRQSLLGIRCAFEARVPAELAPRLIVHVAPVHVVFLLKVVAYLDRPAERERDLWDIAYILERYPDETDERRFSESVLNLGLHDDEVGPYLIGVELDALVNKPERKAMERFVSLVRRGEDPSATQARLLSAGPAIWQQDPNEILRRLSAIERGLGR